MSVVVHLPPVSGGLISGEIVTSGEFVQSVNGSVMEFVGLDAEGVNDQSFVYTVRSFCLYADEVQFVSSEEYFVWHLA